MARRRRFIALALGGLTTGCAPGKPKPTSTSDGESSTSGDETMDTAEDTTGPTTGDTTGPKHDLPQPKYDLPPSEETGDDESGSETGTPRPCLAPPGLGPRD